MPSIEKNVQFNKNANYRRHCKAILLLQSGYTINNALMQGAIMLPYKKQVIPVMPEANKNSNHTKKQDC